MKLDDIKLGEPRGPRIMVSCLRDGETANINKVRTVSFKPGMIIGRNGRRYQVDAKGTQRRVR